MKPYGRDKKVKGLNWKKDVHPPKGYINWWEDICDNLSRPTIKQNWKKEIKEEMEDKYLQEWLEVDKQIRLEQNKILDKIKEKVSEEFFKEVLLELEYCDMTYSYSLENKPKGDKVEDTEYEHVKEIWVNQTTNGGYTGDEFAGSCSIKIGENEYFQFYYSM